MTPRGQLNDACFWGWWLGFKWTAIVVVPIAFICALVFYR